MLFTASQVKNRDFLPLSDSTDPEMIMQRILFAEAKYHNRSIAIPVEKNVLESEYSKLHSCFADLGYVVEKIEFFGKSYIQISW